MGEVARIEDALSRYQKIVVDTMIFVYVLEKHPAYTNCSLKSRVFLPYASDRLANPIPAGQTFDLIRV